MELLNPKICQNRESYKEKEEGMMTEKSITVRFVTAR